MSNISGVVNYAISELSQLSGIKPHTIRMWEQRYGILKPKRTETKIRTYSDHDLRFLMNIALLNRQGYKISKIAELGNEEINKIVNQIEQADPSFEILVDQLTKSMISFDEIAFEKTINTSILRNGFKDTMLQVIYPFLEKIGLLWVTGHINPAQEHFVANLVRQKIIVAIDGQNLQWGPGSKKILLFLPAHELHELSLLFFTYNLKTQNHHTIYLGANLPNADLQPVIDVYQPDYVFTVLTSTLYIKNSVNLLQTTAKNNPKINFKIAGMQAHHAAKGAPKNLTTFQSLPDVLKFGQNL
ncbi:MAG: MerR family transcriptional regulator [Chitinophagales bacterium]|nr:MerR family transcriptional regulator [Chitinophagales bacterium]